MIDENGTPASPEEVEVEEVATEKVEEEQQEGESVEEYKARLTKAEELAENYKKRAEKAEKAAKSAKVPSQDGLAENDIIFLAKTDIHDDDIRDVVKWARNDGVSVKEAFNAYKPILDARKEERNTALATNTKGSARGTSKVSGEDILRKAQSTGEVPDTDEGMMKLAEARFMAGKK